MESTPQTQLVFKQFPGRPSSHCATLTELSDGRVLAVWYAGSREGASDVALLAAAYDGTWSEPWVLLDTPGLPDGNPTLWTAPDGAIHLYHVVIHGHGWDSVLPYYRISTDDGNTWSESALFEDRRGLMFRCRPIALCSGRVVFPVYDETVWCGLCYLSDDGGQSWRASAAMTAPTGCIQPAVVERRDGTLCAYLRTGEEGDCVWQSNSDDGGETWSPCQRTMWPNPNAGIDLLRCHDDAWVLACNPIVQGRGRLSLALSRDEGTSWLELPVEAEPGAEFSYPALLQDRAGRCHLLYTYRRQTIKHVAFEPQWLSDEGRPHPT
ncbi:MAG: sialidase family protein [Armatimonadota bacterium]